MLNMFRMLIHPSSGACDWALNKVINKTSGIKLVSLYSTILRYPQCNIVILMAEISLRHLHRRGGGGNFLWGHLKSTVDESHPHTVQKLLDNISHAVAAIKIAMWHRVYLNMVSSQLLTDCSKLLTDCSNTLRSIQTNARENITRTRAKRKAGYIFVAHRV